MRILGIGLAGFVGAIGRYWIDGLISRRVSRAFPWGTLVVNVSGCVLLGIAFVLMTERTRPNPAVRAAVTTGLLGAYTTFSTFSLETVRLFEDGAAGPAMLNVVGSLVLGIAGIYAGIFVGRSL